MEYPLLLFFFWVRIIETVKMHVTAHLLLVQKNNVSAVAKCFECQLCGFPVVDHRFPVVNHS